MVLEVPLCPSWALAMEGPGRLTAMLPGSPVLPLPVELVAGGEGRPELTELTGLGGSGRSGRVVGVDTVVLLLAWPLLLVL